MNKATRDYNKVRNTVVVDDITDCASKFNLSNSRQYLEEILKKYNVLEYYYQYRLHLPIASNRDYKIYHGKNHTDLMILNCYEGALFENINHSQIKALLIAAIFHDSRHTLGALSDDENIKKAIQDLRVKHKYLVDLSNKTLISRNHVITESELDLAIKCIRHTRYPYIRKGYIAPNESSVLFKIIRDADLMNIYYNNPDVVLDLYIGLYNEMQNSRKISVDNFINECFVFLNKIQWNSNWAKKKAFLLNWPKIVKETIANLSLNKQSFPVFED